MREELKKAIENEFVRKAPKGFSDKVMDKIFEIKAELKFKPLISKWGWFGIIAGVLAVVAVVFKTPVAEESSGGGFFAPYFEKASQHVGDVNFQLPGFLSDMNLMMLLMGVSLALFLLVGFDLLLFNRKKERG
jgi:hypothetical protein